MLRQFARRLLRPFRWLVWRLTWEWNNHREQPEPFRLDAFDLDIEPGLGGLQPDYRRHDKAES